MDPTRALRTLSLAAAALVIIGVAGHLLTQPPAALPASAPATEFSAARARAQLEQILGNQAPHPTGTAASAAVRARIVAALEHLGLHPRVQEAFACSDRGVCATVRNVIAVIPGREDGRSILAACHYDSVPAGTGAADDGASVAGLLESARALLAGPPPRHPVTLLFDEGEELGLLGARAFMDQDPAWRSVGAIVNGEARGTSGASSMFETSGANGWLVAALARALPHPNMSSLYTAIYDVMPNRTDVTVFKQQHMPAVNFAFIGDPIFYHTTHDDLAHLDSRSLQHQGENVLASIRALDSADLESPPPDRVVFFDVLGRFVLRWPQQMSLLLALLSLALVLGRLAMPANLHRLRAGHVARCLGALIVALFVAVLLGLALSWLLMRRPDASTWWIATPGFAVAAAWGIGLATTLGMTHVLRRLGGEVLWIAVWLVWSSAGVILARALPGASYIFTLPALVAGIAGLIEPAAMVRPTVLPSLVAGLVCLPVLDGWYDALGVPMLGALSLGAVLLGSTLAPLMAPLDDRARVALGRSVGFGSLALIVVAMALPQHSEQVPAHLSFIRYEDGDTGKTRWLAEATGRHLSADVDRLGPFEGPLSEPSWNVADFFAHDTAPAGLPPPLATVFVEEIDAYGRRLVRIHLASQRGADVMQIAFGPESGLRAVSVNGTEAEVGASHRWQRYSVWGLAKGGVEIIATLEAQGSPEIVVADMTFGLPAQGAELAAARGVAAVPYQGGDRVVVTKRVNLPAR